MNVIEAQIQYKRDRYGLEPTWRMLRNQIRKEAGYDLELIYLNVCERTRSEDKEKK